MTSHLSEDEKTALGEYGLPRDVLDAFAYDIVDPARPLDVFGPETEVRDLVDLLEESYLRATDSWAISNPWHREVQIRSDAWEKIKDDRPARLKMLSHQAYHLLQMRGWSPTVWAVTYGILGALTVLTAWTRGHRPKASNHPLEKPAYELSRRVYEQERKRQESAT